ncbi:hypothetical protein C8Q78DRAFT_1004508 [Trametes maxima]|nr:hypothetical protein C8Q78DRAFT_1004508 [Trametes maxima]
MGTITGPGAPGLTPERGAALSRFRRDRETYFTPGLSRTATMRLHALHALAGAARARLIRACRLPWIQKKPTIQCIVCRRPRSLTEGLFAQLCARPFPARPRSTSRPHPHPPRASRAGHDEQRRLAQTARPHRPRPLRPPANQLREKRTANLMSCRGSSPARAAGRATAAGVGWCWHSPPLNSKSTVPGKRGQVASLRPTPYSQHGVRPWRT